MNIFVANLNFDLSEPALQELFQSFGQVSSVKIIKDFNTGRSKGYGFVEMPVQQEAENAIKSLNNQAYQERNLVVKVARDSKGKRFR